MKCQHDHGGSAENAKMWRADDIGDVELLHARYITYSFARHTHEGAAIGVIEDGAESFEYKGATYTAPKGNLVVFNPGDAHTGQGADEYGWRFRIFYIDSGLLQRAASELADKPRGIPFFPAPIIRDEATAQLIRSLHISLEEAGPSLERESRFIWTFAQFIAHHADDKRVELPVRSEHSAVKQIRDYLEEHYTENVSLEEISDLTHLRSYHLIRSFRAEVGLPPHAYLEQVRVNRAKALLRAGMPIIEVALSVGFIDQSHFTRHFKKMMGVTPGQYQTSARTYKTTISL